jgi:tRNA(Ile)-lysidine synthase
MPRPLTPATLRPFWSLFRRYVAAQRVFDNLGPLQGPLPAMAMCISGGPDSMALAYLLSNHVKTSPDAQGLSRMHAFIIDHGMRPGSRSEAEMVAGWVESMGISAVVQSMDWEGDDPIKIRAGEQDARRRRYRHLGDLARHQHIEHLFTGHHRDDQIETLLYRLGVLHPNLLGLRGMQVRSSLPEAEGFYGYRNEPTPVPIQTMFQDAPTGLIPDYLSALGSSRTVPVLRSGRIQGLRHGGIEIYRPLLNFRKADLIATCEANNIPYVKDKTNDDPTYTRRNAVRLMRKEFRLPRALQERSMLKLCRSSREAAEGLEDRTAHQLKKISILSFDFTSGRTEVAIPQSFKATIRDDPIVAAMVVSKVASIVSPTAADTRETLAPNSITELLNFALHHSWWTGPGTSRAPMFTFDGVFFEALATPPETAQVKTLWRLSRAPMTSAASRSRQEVEFRGDAMGSPQDSQWCLWDFRYWFRLKCDPFNLMYHFRVRPYQPSDTAWLKSTLDKVAWEVLQTKFRRHAPGKARYTLPVLTFDGFIVAFPTLFDVPLCEEVFLQQAYNLQFMGRPTFSWDVAYKLLPKDLASWGTYVHKSGHEEEIKRLQASRKHPNENLVRHATRNFDLLPLRVIPDETSAEHGEKEAETTLPTDKIIYRPMETRNEHV